MKKIVMIFAVLLLFSAGVVQAGDYNAVTGDVELNLMLGDLNIHARGDTENFITELGVTYGTDEAEIGVLFSKYDMEPADVYMAVRLSNMTGESLHHVAGMHRNGKGWGAIAKSLGIKPGSAEFHALKEHHKGKHAKGRKHKGGKHKGEKGKKGKGH
ncbi:MAG: hypothetical protein V3V95_08200 [Thermodesulfobacteriota bacterium]